MNPKLTLWMATFATACAAPDLDGLFVSLEASRSQTPADVNEAFIERIDGASETLSIALPGLDDMAIADALIGAWSRGVDVRFVSDEERAEDPGIVALAEAGVPMRLADPGITFFDFDASSIASWGSDEVRMTHAFAIADTFEWIIATRAGTSDPGPDVWFSGHGEDLSEVLSLEHNQVFGGTDAAAADAFNAPAKSINDTRWLFWGGSDESIRVHFGPQERLIKTLIDMIYGARSSVRILTEDISDRGVATALQLKAADGFDVEVIVGRDFGSTYPPASEVLRRQTPDVGKYQAAAQVTLPTLVFIDFDRGLDGDFHRPKVIAITHPLLSTARTDLGVAVSTDQYCDATMVVLEVDGEPSAPLQDLARVYFETRAVTTELVP